MSYFNRLPEIGTSTAGRAVTATLYVSPNGAGSDGKTWATAFTTIQAALDAVSTNAHELTLILIGASTTAYDIDTTGDPTWTGNYELMGSHRNWAKIENNHASATSVMKFTGRISLINLTIDCGTGTNDGVIITGSGTKGVRVKHTYFECEHVTGAQTGLEVSGGTEYVRLEDVKFHGVQANTTGLLIDDVKFSDFDHLQFHDCLTGMQLTNADTDNNRFSDILFDTCTIGLDLDAGNNHICESFHFFNCTTNIDDEVGDSAWNNIQGEFAITIEPDDFTGVAVNTGDGADTWTAADVEVRAAATSTVPFRIVGLNLEAGTSEKYRIRLTADGTNYFDDFQFEGVATGINTQSFSFPPGTDFVFNKGTQIKASSKSESAGVDNLNVWLKIQEI